MVKPFLVFDMDGVLVDVTDSYRETIVQTVRFFTGHEPSRTRIQEYKNAGGWNDDWELSQQLCADFGVTLDLKIVAERFTRFFLGEGGTPGLIGHERWIAKDGLLERLSLTFRLAIFTGRHDFEVAPTLFRFCPTPLFDPIITVDRVSEPKPSPEGLYKIAALEPESKIWYVGDTVDDARSSQAAGVRFIGIAEAGKPRYEETRAVLMEHGAVAVLDDINELERVLMA